MPIWALDLLRQDSMLFVCIIFFDFSDKADSPSLLHFPTSTLRRPRTARPMDDPGTPGCSFVSPSPSLPDLFFLRSWADWSPWELFLVFSLGKAPLIFLSKVISATIAPTGTPYPRKLCGPFFDRSSVLLVAPPSARRGALPDRYFGPDFF